MEQLLLLQSLIPKDFELPIPGNVPFFQFLIIFSFACHIIFVNITIAGAVFAVFNEWKGMRTKNVVFDKLAFQLATQTSIYKSIAVVLGVAPMLLISVIYSQFFYPSTILIGKAWLSLILLITIAFLLLYVYKFSWTKYKNEKKGLHFFIGLIGAVMLLFVPLIFIVNVVSMLYPDMWEGSKGFFHGLFYYPQVWQRYFHFILSSFAVMGIFMYIYNNRMLKKLQTNTVEHSRAEQEVAATLESLSQEDVVKEGKRFGVKVALWTTVLQFVVGSLVLVSLEKDKMMLYMGENMLLTSMLAASIVITVALTYFLYMVMKTDAKHWIQLSATAFILVIAIMGWMRHEVRESYVNPYQELNPPTAQVEDVRNYVVQ